MIYEEEEAEKKLKIYNVSLQIFFNAKNAEREHRNRETEKQKKKQVENRTTLCGLAIWRGPENRTLNMVGIKSIGPIFRFFLSVFLISLEVEMHLRLAFCIAEIVLWFMAIEGKIMSL